MEMTKNDRRINIALIMAIIFFGTYTLFSAYKVADIKRSYSIREITYSKIADTCTTVSSGYKDEIFYDGSSRGEDDFPVKADFDELNSICTFGSIIGWVYSPGTLINYPVAQCDDNYYYLKHLIDGTENPSGAIYCDFRSQQNFEGENTVIYGHHMADGSMLASIKNYYSKESYYDEHPCIYLSTPYKNYTLEVFSAYQTVTSDDKTFSVSFSEDFTFKDYIDHLKANNAIKGIQDVSVTTMDRVVLFVTCAYQSENGRSVLACVIR